jgi:hypothetical protein
MRWKEIVETASCGATGSASIATAPGGLGMGFDPKGDKGIYQNKKKRKKTDESMPIIRR